MCYGAQIWGFQRFEPVEKLLRFFIKKLLRLPYNTPNYALLMETGRETLFVYTLKLHWAFVLHTLGLPDHRFSKILLLKGIENEHKWFRFLKEEALKKGTWDLFGDCRGIHIKQPLEALYPFVVKNEQDSLFSLARNGQYHPFYKTLKLEWGREEYFNNKLSLREIGLIMMARTEMLPLNCKLWFPENDHKCSLCNMKAVENVQHFVMDCPILKEFRSEAFNGVDCVELLKGEVGWKLVAGFVGAALNYRSQLVEEFNN